MFCKLINDDDVKMSGNISNGIANAKSLSLIMPYLDILMSNKPFLIFRLCRLSPGTPDLRPGKLENFRKTLIDFTKSYYQHFTPVWQPQQNTLAPEALINIGTYLIWSKLFASPVKKSQVLRYSGDINTGHPKTGVIWILGKKSQFISLVFGQPFQTDTTNNQTRLKTRPIRYPDAHCTQDKLSHFWEPLQ